MGRGIEHCAWWIESPWNRNGWIFFQNVEKQWSWHGRSLAPRSSDAHEWTRMDTNGRTGGANGFWGPGTWTNFNSGFLIEILSYQVTLNFFPIGVSFRTSSTVIVPAPGTVLAQSHRTGPGNLKQKKNKTKKKHEKIEPVTGHWVRNDTLKKKSQYICSIGCNFFQPSY